MPTCLPSVDARASGPCERQRAFRGGVLWLLVASLLLAACGDDGASPVPATPAEAGGGREAVDVFTTRVERVELAQSIESTGTVAAHMTTDILPLVGGLVDEVYVSVGDRVEEGEALFAMRTVDLKLRHRELVHALELAQTEAADAVADLRRSESLALRQAVSEDAVADLRTRVAAAGAQVGIAEVRVAQALQALDDAVVRAPFRGVITARNVNDGAFIETRGMTMQPAVQIMKIDIVAAIVMVPEAYVAQITPGTAATVRLDGLDREYESIVHIVNDRVDPETRAFEARVGLANEDYAIHPGLFCRVVFHPPGRSALVLDRTAVRGSQAGRYVYVAEGTTARRRPVGVRELDMDRVEITDGLVAGDVVLVGANIERLADGTPVRLPASSAVATTNDGAR